mgnify:CR=1 FL=1
MGHIITDLKETFRRGNTFIRLIYINVGIFVIGTLISVILQLFNLSATGIFDLFALPASLHRFILQPWSLLSYMFMHAGFLHILFNMLALWSVGPVLEKMMGHWPFLALYVLSGLGGGLGLMSWAALWPGGTGWLGGAYGASGALFGLFAAMLVVYRRIDAGLDGGQLPDAVPGGRYRMAGSCRRIHRRRRVHVAAGFRRARVAWQEPDVPDDGVRGGGVGADRRRRAGL